MKCSCKHGIREHIFNTKLESYDECKVCDCEGFDMAGDNIDELELGR